MTAPSPESIAALLLDRYEGVIPRSSWGETAFFYNPGEVLPSGTYFATIKEKDGENDRASNLDRPGLWRLNIGTQKPQFIERFGAPPSRPAKGQTIAGDWDFTAQDQLMPHPVYGWMSWVSVINPSRATLDSCLPLVDAAYEKAVKSFQNRIAKGQSLK